jgi:hypothetical protein
VGLLCESGAQSTGQDDGFHLRGKVGRGGLTQRTRQAAGLGPPGGNLANAPVHSRDGSARSAGGQQGRRREAKPQERSLIGTMACVGLLCPANTSGTGRMDGACIFSVTD